MVERVCVMGGLRLQTNPTQPVFLLSFNPYPSSSFYYSSSRNESRSHSWRAARYLPVFDPVASTFTSEGGEGRTRRGGVVADVLSHKARVSAAAKTGND